MYDVTSKHIYIQSTHVPSLDQPISAYCTHGGMISIREHGHLGSPRARSEACTVKPGIEQLEPRGQIVLCTLRNLKEN